MGALPTSSSIPPPPDPILDRLLQQDRFHDAAIQAVKALRSRSEALGPLAYESLVRLERVGEVAWREGDLATAEVVYDLVIDAYRRTLPRGDPRVAPSLIGRVRLAEMKNERARARRLLDEAATILRAAGPEWEIVRSDLDIAEGVLLRPENFEASLACYRRSIERLERVSPSGSFLETLRRVALGYWLSRAGRASEADACLHRGMRELQAMGLTNNSMIGMISGVFADRLALEGRWDEAEPLYRTASEIAFETRAKNPVGFSRRAPMNCIEVMARIALHRGRFEEAWNILQRSAQATYQDFALLGSWRNKDPDGYEQARRLRLRLLELRHRRDADASAGRSSWDDSTWRRTIEFLELQNRVRSLELGYLRSVPHPEPSLAKVQSLLGPRTALIGSLEMLLGTDPTDRTRIRYKERWISIVRASGPVQWVFVPEHGDRDEMARFGQAWPRLRRAMSWSSHVAPDPEVRADMRVLSRHLLDPMLPLVRGVDHLVFEGPTYPQEALIGPDGRWIGEEFDVSYVPSGFVASLLAEGRTSGPAPAPRSILAVSASPGEGAIGIAPSGEPFAPALDEGTRRVRGAYTRADARLDQLPRLPYSGREVSSVARQFAEATVVQGSSDVESRLWKIVRDGKLAQYDVLHVAGHALTDVAAERCGLVLSEFAPRPGLAEDGVLDVEEMLLGWNLDVPPFITFSGCETAAPAGAPNYEMLGFVPVVLAAGARNILASLWPADDRATALLMERFYENLTGRYSDTQLGVRAAPLPPAHALREAKSYLRSLKDPSGRPIYEHPVYWAGFILIGIPDGS